VEGAEKALTVTTAEGNEQSRSNDAERDEAVSTHLHLWDKMPLLSYISTFKYSDYSVQWRINTVPMLVLISPVTCIYW